MIPNYLKYILKSGIFVLINISFGMGLVYFIPIEKKLEILFNCMLFLIIIIMNLCIRIPGLVRGISMIVCLEKGELIEADVIEFEGSNSPPAIAKICYIYSYEGTKHMDKDRCWYCNRDLFKLNMDENSKYQKNVKIPIVVYRRKTFALFHCIGLYDELYYGKMYISIFGCNTP